ncbi:MAG: hypothetical protein AAGA90_01500 [Actinomycetota bacterium]
MDWITKADWDRFAAVPLDPDAQPGYEVLKGCLIWPDEYVDGLSRPGWELLGDLFVARGLLHRGQSIAAWPGGSDHLQRRWDVAVGAGLPWAGFARTELTAAQHAFLAAEAGQSLLADA